MATLTIEEIKNDPEVLRLNELMRTTAIAINQRLDFLYKENGINSHSPVFEVLSGCSSAYGLNGQSDTFSQHTNLNNQ